MDDIRFDGRVAVVTGAGGGLGRAHALLLASRGAKVVVNDLGGSADGSGAGTSMADQAVDEIKAGGGEAVANYASVDHWEGGESIVQTAIDSFGKLDICICNAGILRDRTIAKMTDEEYARVIEVHLNGTWYTARAAVPRMRENGYGRLVFTSSGAGLWGNFGQTNYSAAKLGIVGMMLALKLEVEKYGILVNTISPIAASRLLGTILDEQAMETLDPHFVSVMVAYLVSEQNTDTGGIYMAGGGQFGKAQMVANRGIVIKDKNDITIENVASQIDEIRDMSEAKPFASALARRQAREEEGW